MAVPEQSLLDKSMSFQLDTWQNPKAHVSTPTINFEFLVMLFGQTNAPAMFIDLKNMICFPSFGQICNDICR